MKVTWIYMHICIVKYCLYKTYSSIWHWATKFSPPLMIISMIMRRISISATSIFMWAISYANQKVPYIRKLTYVFQQGFVSYQPVANLTMYTIHTTHSQFSINNMWRHEHKMRLYCHENFNQNTKYVCVGKLTNTSSLFPVWPSSAIVFPTK